MSEPHSEDVPLPIGGERDGECDWSAFDEHGAPWVEAWRDNDPADWVLRLAGGRAEVRLDPPIPPGTFYRVDAAPARSLERYLIKEIATGRVVDRVGEADGRAEAVRRMLEHDKRGPRRAVERLEEQLRREAELEQSRREAEERAAVEAEREQAERDERDQARDEHGFVDGSTRQVLWASAIREEYRRAMVAYRDRLRSQGHDTAEADRLIAAIEALDRVRPLIDGRDRGPVETLRRAGKHGLSEDELLVARRAWILGGTR